MWENQIIHTSSIDVQKTLNQWRHKYQFKVQSITACPHTKGHVFCYLARREKPATK